METISIEIDIRCLGIDRPDRNHFAKQIDQALRDSGAGEWCGCRWVLGKVVVFVMTEDPEGARAVVLRCVQG